MKMIKKIRIMVLICLPSLLGVPMWVVWAFVKDLSIVLFVSAALLLAVGVYKMVVMGKRFKKKAAVCL